MPDSTAERERRVIPTTLNASALRDPDGKVIGAIGILRDMREYKQVVRRPGKDPRARLQEKILDLENSRKWSWAAS